MGLLSDIIKPRHICDLLEHEPHYQQNRERLGVVLHQGWSYWDGYQRVRPALFYGSLAMFAVSSFLWYRRGWQRSGKRAAEAHVVYPAMMALSGTVAYVSKKTGPSLLEAQPARPGERRPQAGEAAIVKAIDKKAATLKRKDPKFADRAIARTIRIPGIYGVWQQTPGHVQAMIHCGKVAP